VSLWCLTRRFDRCSSGAAAWSQLETFHATQPTGCEDWWDSVCRPCSSPAVVSWKRWLGEQDWRSALEASRVGRALTRRAFLCVARVSRDSTVHNNNSCNCCTGVDPRVGSRCRSRKLDLFQRKLSIGSRHARAMWLSQPQHHTRSS
jgi:hypothetical protein